MVQAAALRKPASVAFVVARTPSTQRLLKKYSA